jgi:ATPase subunit of ABC transporter with duplicated ATPase domains
MAHAHLEFHDLHFEYDRGLEPVFSGFSGLIPRGWTGVIGANGAGKTTLLKLAAGELIPTRGSVQRIGSFALCTQTTEEPPDALADFLAARDSLSMRLRGALAVEADRPTRWGTLSHGERKRAQIAVALWQEPDILAVDEPTNHIDSAARALLLAALKQFRGIGLLVSHDRELLDSLCRQCLFLRPPAMSLYPGGYSSARELADAADARAREEWDQRSAEANRLRELAAEREREAARSHTLRSKRHIDPKDHDAKFRINLARLSGKDGQAGRLRRQIEGRAQQAEKELRSVSVRKQYRMGIRWQSERSRRDLLFSLPAGEIPLGPDTALRHPDLLMRPLDRVAVTGANGSGKSTLIRAILGRLNLPAGSVIYLAQEIPEDQSLAALRQVLALPPVERGEILTLVRRLGSDPARLLEGAGISPGEARKLILARGILAQPQLIIMDEPTNHLDLPSIECLEAALAECVCGLLLVSHDERFLDSLTQIRWQLVQDNEGDARLSIRFPAHL